MFPRPSAPFGAGELAACSARPADCTRAPALAGTGKFAAESTSCFITDAGVLSGDLVFGFSFWAWLAVRSLLTAARLPLAALPLPAGMSSSHCFGSPAPISFRPRFAPGAGLSACASLPVSCAASCDLAKSLSTLSRLSVCFLACGFDRLGAMAARRALVLAVQAPRLDSPSPERGGLTALPRRKRLPKAEWRPRPAWRCLCSPKAQSLRPNPDTPRCREHAQAPAPRVGAHRGRLGLQAGAAAHGAPRGRSGPRGRLPRRPARRRRRPVDARRRRALACASPRASLPCCSILASRGEVLPE